MHTFTPILVSSRQSRDNGQSEFDWNFIRLWKDSMRHFSCLFLLIFFFFFDFTVHRYFLLLWEEFLRAATRRCLIHFNCPFEDIYHEVNNEEIYSRFNCVFLNRAGISFRGTFNLCLWSKEWLTVNWHKEARKPRIEIIETIYSLFFLDIRVAQRLIVACLLSVYSLSV